MTGVPVVTAEGLTAGYGDLAAVRDIDLSVNRGEIVALFGPNGAGKSTTLLALVGVLTPMKGTVAWMGEPTAAPLHKRIRQGLAFVPEEKSLVMGMSVKDNLRLGRGELTTALDMFPELGKILNRRAGVLSGGEQQMVTLGRAIASRPAALVVDELSLGLAPIVVNRLLDGLRAVARDLDIAVLLVEQQARRAMDVADRWYLLKNGRVCGSGDADSSTELLEETYFSSSTG